MADKTPASGQRFFIDREDSMHALRSSYTRLGETSESQVVFILGEAGIGKTSLVEQFLSTIDTEQAYVLHVRGYEEQSSPLFPFIETVKSFLSRYRIVDRKYVLDTIMNLTKLIPMAEPVVGPIQQIIKDGRGLSDVDKYSINNSYLVFSNYLSMIRKIAGKKTVILNIDDAQWLDDASFELLSYLIKKVTGNVLIIVSYRIGFITSLKEFEAQKRLDQILRSVPSEKSTVIKLKSLNESLYPQFISGFLGPHKLDKSDLKELFSHTEGNPFFLKSTIDMLKEYGSLNADANGVWSFVTDSSVQKKHDVVPKSLYETIMRRLKRAYSDIPGAREIIAYASVMGYKFELDMLSKFLKKDKLEVYHVLQELGNTFSIVRTIDNGETYVFDHRKTQEAIYDSLGIVAADCHLRIAEFLETSYDGKNAAHNPFIIAYHYRKGKNWSLALKFLKISAETAFGGYFYSDAVREYRECLSIIEEHGVTLSQSELYSLRLGYCKALLGSNMFQECIAGLDNLLLSHTLPESQKAEALLMLGRCYRMEGNPDSGTKAIQSVKSSLQILERLRDAGKLGEVYSYLATVYDHFGHFEEAVKAFEQSQIYYNQANDYSGLARLQRKSGMIFESRRAIGFMKNALLTFEKYSMKIEKARCLNNIGAESFYISDFAQAEEHLAQSLELFRILDSPEIDIPLNNLALVYQQKADYEKSMQYLEDAHSNVSEPFNEIFIGMNMANIHRKTGTPEKAKQIIVHLESSIASYHEPVMNDYYGFNRSMIHLDLDEIDDAEKWLTRFEPNDYKRDGELVLAKRYRALSGIMEKRRDADRNKIGELKNKSLEMFRTARPQKWFYELDYYPCDIHVWD